MINGGMTRKGICLIKAVRKFSRHASEFCGMYSGAGKAQFVIVLMSISSGARLMHTPI